MNILLKEADSFYLKGMRSLLNDVFSQQGQEQVNFLTEYNPYSIQQADIIIMTLCRGEYYTCIPELRFRQQGIIIGLFDEDSDEDAVRPGCYRDISFVPRNVSLACFVEFIRKAWSDYQQQNVAPATSSCVTCRHKILSLQQSRIIDFLNRGIPVTEIAQKLNISDRTIFSHKYAVMRKFGLHNDFQLHTLLSRMAARSPVSNHRDRWLEGDRPVPIHAET